MTVDWDLAYDRRVSEPFLAHFLGGGVAHSLVEYARFARYPVDLQMRHSPKTGEEHATLYVGLTAVLNVNNKKGGLQLVGHKSTADGAYGFDDGWTTPMSVVELGQTWRRVEDYLEAIIPDATAKHASREGAVQTAVSGFTADNRIMLDREVGLHFRDNATKKVIFEKITSRLVQAVKAVPGVPGRPPTSFGGECDLLALDEKGQLLAIEVKPRSTGSIVWAGVQATVYAELLRLWLRTPPPSSDSNMALMDPPAVVLRGMLEQRVRLGLAGPTHADLTDQPVVVPIVAIQRGANPKYLQHLQTVQAALADAGIGDGSLKVYEVSMTGRLDQRFPGSDSHAGDGKPVGDV